MSTLTRRKTAAKKKRALKKGDVLRNRNYGLSEYDVKVVGFANARKQIKVRSVWPTGSFQSGEFVYGTKERLLANDLTKLGKRFRLPA